MFQHQGVWLPDGEQHFPQWMDQYGEVVDGRGTYQIKKFREAMKWCRQFRGAVDVGGHVGLWSMQLVRKFLHVEAFEPVESFRKCYEKNVGDNSAYTLWGCALGATRGTVSMAIDRADTGGTHVTQGTDIELNTLDHVHFLFPMDFLKIDCEGYELQVVQGGEETIRRCQPCIIVEQKKHKLESNYGVKGQPAVELLKSWGAKVRIEMGGDYILSWDKR